MGAAMTALKRAVRRWYDWGRGPVAITLHPSGLIEFRERGRRKRYYITIGQAFVSAVAKSLAQEKAEKTRRKRRSR